jgi:hypothetical protein
MINGRVGLAPHSPLRRRSYVAPAVFASYGNVIAALGDNLRQHNNNRQVSTISLRQLLLGGQYFDRAIDSNGTNPNATIVS